MKRDEILKALSDIGTIEDAAERRVKITELTEGVTEILNSNDTLTSANAKFEADNKKLQEYNMQLFLRVGSQQKKPEEQKQPSENLTYDNLFNEKGELK